MANKKESTKKTVTFEDIQANEREKSRKKAESGDGVSFEDYICSELAEIKSILVALKG